MDDGADNESQESLDYDSPEGWDGMYGDNYPDEAEIAEQQASHELSKKSLDAAYGATNLYDFLPKDRKHHPKRTINLDQRSE